MTNRKHILIVDGDPQARDEIAKSLAGPRFELSIEATGRSALALAAREKLDVVVTELVLPDMTGIGLCRLLRENPATAQIGLLVLTTLESEIDRVLAFEAGVDDFLPKPFYGRELASRVIAILRRSGAPREASGSPMADSLEAVTVQASTACAWVGERRLDLTPRELQLLSALIRQAGRVLTREQLVMRVWGEDSDPSGRVVDAHVKSIRRKLGDARECLQTVRGVGYRFSEQGARLPTTELRGLETELR